MMLHQSTRVFIVLSLTLYQFPRLVKSAVPCKLCPDEVALDTGGYGPVSSRANFVCPNGKTCDTIYGEVLTKLHGSSECSSVVKSYRSLCCYASNSPGAVVAAAPKPVTRPSPVMAEGKEPVCHICKGGLHPGSNATRISSQFLEKGSETFATLYTMGRTKNIPAAACYPLRLYCANPCKCPTSRRRYTRGLGSEEDEDLFASEELEKLFQVVHDDQPEQLLLEAHDGQAELPEELSEQV